MLCHVFMFFKEISFLFLFPRLNVYWVSLGFWASDGDVGKSVIV